MIVHDVHRFPAHNPTWSAGYSIGSLSEADLKEVKQLLAPDEIWYWYGKGCYEGAGQLIARRGDQYTIHSLNHCSCYGPVERIMETVWMSFDDILMGTQEYLRDLEPILTAIVGNAEGYDLSPFAKEVLVEMGILK